MRSYVAHLVRKWLDGIAVHAVARADGLIVAGNLRHALRNAAGRGAWRRPPKSIASFGQNKRHSCSQKGLESRPHMRSIAARTARGRMRDAAPDQRCRPRGRANEQRETTMRSGSLRGPAGRRHAAAKPSARHGPALRRPDAPAADGEHRRGGRARDRRRLRAPSRSPRPLSLLTWDPYTDPRPRRPLEAGDRRGRALGDPHSPTRRR